MLTHDVTLMHDVMCLGWPGGVGRPANLMVHVVYNRCPGSNAPAVAG